MDAVTLLKEAQASYTKLQEIEEQLLQSLMEALDISAEQDPNDRIFDFLANKSFSAEQTVAFFESQGILLVGGNSDGLH